MLWVVRHGQSAGNVARDAATEQGLARIPLTHRDVDVPLSDLGRQQASALGRWFAEAHEDGRPEVLLSSPYVRAVETARLFRENGGCAPDEPVCIDERLREKEFGILDGLTTSGIHQLQPDQAEFRRLLGKFYHRPPGGESWVDVIFRLRALMDTVSLHHAGQRVMIVAHQVVVLCLRYIIEGLDEALGALGGQRVGVFEIRRRGGHPADDALRRCEVGGAASGADAPQKSRPDGSAAHHADQRASRPFG